MSAMRTLLDRLYAVSLWLAALNLVAIALLVGTQVLARVSDKILTWLGIEPFNFAILSLAEIAGYLLAGASFLALAGTLKAGGHIRMTMLLSTLRGRVRSAVEFFSLAVAAAFSGYMTWHMMLLVQDSLAYNEVSKGVVPVPLAYPQASMALGLLVLTVALVDEFVQVIRFGEPSFGRSEQDITLGKDG